MKRRFKVHSTEMPVGQLRLNARTNREVKPARVRRLVRAMDPDALGRFAAWRDGRNFYVIDGQHRKLALEDLGLPDWPVLCDVYEGMSFEDACEQFLKLNDSLLVTAYEKFDKGVKAGRYECVETKKVIESCGFRVSNQVGDGNLVSVAGAIDTFNLDQGDALRRALTWSSAAWGHTTQATDGYLLRGLGLIAHAYPNGEIDDAAFVKKLAKHGGGSASLIGSAKNARSIKGGSLARSLACIVIDIYNKGRRSSQLAPL